MKKRLGTLLSQMQELLPAAAVALLAVAFLIGIFPVPAAPFSARISAEGIPDVGVYPAVGGNLYFDKSTGTLLACDPSVISAEVPAAVNGVLVKQIGDNAFAGCTQLSSLVLPDSLETIGAMAFSNCASLEEILIPESVKTIGTAAFIGCASLTGITIPAGVTSLSSPMEGATEEDLLILRQMLFYGCMSLNEIHVSGENSVFASLDGVLYSKDLSHMLAYPGGRQDEVIRIPDSVTQIDPIGISSYTATSFSVGENNSAFASENGCLLSRDGTVLVRSSVLALSAVPSGVRKIGDFAFFSCVADSLVLPDSVTEIGKGAFFMSLTGSLSLPAGLEKIGDGAFYQLLPSEIIFRGTGEEWSRIEIDEEAFMQGDRVTDLEGNLLYYAVLNGDLNLDGEVDSIDATLMARHLAKWDVEIDFSAADINGNGEVNSLDGTLLSRYLAHWDVPYFNPVFF